MNPREHAKRILATDLNSGNYDASEYDDEYLLSGSGWNIYRKGVTLYIHIDDGIVSNEDVKLDQEMVDWIEEVL